MGTSGDANVFYVDEDGDVVIDGAFNFVDSYDKIFYDSRTLYFVSGRANVSANDVFSFKPEDASDGEMTDTDGRQAWVSILPRVDQSGTAAYDALYVNVDEDGTGDGSTGDGNNLINVAINDVSKFIVDNSGNVGIGTTTPQGKTQWSDSDTHGGLVLNTYYATSGTLTADHTITIQVNVPSGARIQGAQLHVKTALAGGETWNAQYVTGATQSIGTAQAVAQNTNLSTFFDVNTDTDIASDEVDITIQRSSNPGVDAFSAQGEIECVVYAWIFDTWDNE